MSAPRPAQSTAAERLLALLLSPRLPWWLAGASTLLLAPTLLVGFHLDDFVHRYLFSGLPGADDLLHAYQSPFGIANGDPATNHFQIEAGYAPWWTPPDLLISLWRPLSTLGHWFDAALFPASAPLQHLHSLLLHFALVWLASRFFLCVLGRGSVAGLAAFLYAFDHAHGFAAGWIANRNALACALLGVGALLLHHEGAKGDEPGSARARWFSPIVLLAALLAGEGAVAVFVYLLGYALFVQQGKLARRVASLAPHAFTLVAWRIAYTALGRGARLSGLYLDPLREPLVFAKAAVTRMPLLVLGELGLPPAEAHSFLAEPLARAQLALACVMSVWFAISAYPLVRGDRHARFFAFGLVGSLLAACSTHPHNRLLFFAGLGAMGLSSQLWHGLVEGASWLSLSGVSRALARPFAALVVGFHLVLSPPLLPVTGCSIALTSNTERQVRAALAAAHGRELVVVSAPDYFDVKLLPVLAALEHRTPPKRLRALSFGAVPLVVKRRDERTLDIEFEGGLLREPLMTLYRARELELPVGTRVALQNLEIEVLKQTQDHLVAEARFRFARSLEDPELCFLVWQDDRYTAFAVPKIGESARVAPARVHFGL